MKTVENDLKLINNIYKVQSIHNYTQTYTTHTDITLLMVTLMMMDGLVHWDFDGVRMGYMDMYGLFYPDWYMFLYRVGDMFNNGVWDDLFNGNTDFGLNWHSYGFVDGHLDWVGVGYSNKDRFGYAHVNCLMDWVCDVFVLRDFHGVLFIDVLAYRVSLSLSKVVLVTEVVASVFKDEALLPVTSVSTLVTVTAESTLVAVTSESTLTSETVSV